MLDGPPLGVLLAPTSKLRAWLVKLQNNNAQGEYYLTDIVAMAVRDGITVHTVQPGQPWEVEGVNWNEPGSWFRQRAC